ncbi:MAG TPA: DUF6498-containing protein [Thermoanaerobaculia bacterium]|nr:DUF6498-containing protein [Thermoanaerobaculia bacterium]
MNPSLSCLRRLPGMGRVLRALGIGGVPAAGYFGAGWSLGTLLLLYWLETILVTLVVAVLILRHRHATRTAGHFSRIKSSSERYCVPGCRVLGRAPAVAISSRTLSHPAWHKPLSSSRWWRITGLPSTSSPSAWGHHTRRPGVVLYVNGLHPGCNGSAGGGIEGMRQRLAAVGSRLEIAAEAGTRVRAWLSSGAAASRTAGSRGGARRAEADSGLRIRRVDDDAGR